MPSAQMPFIQSPFFTICDLKKDFSYWEHFHWFIQPPMKQPAKGFKPPVSQLSRSLSTNGFDCLKKLWIKLFFFLSPHWCLFPEVFSSTFYVAPFALPAVVTEGPSWVPPCPWLATLVGSVPLKDSRDKLDRCSVYVGVLWEWEEKEGVCDESSEWGSDPLECWIQRGGGRACRCESPRDHKREEFWGKK